MPGKTIVQYYQDALDRMAAAKQRLDAVAEITAENAVEYGSAYLENYQAELHLSDVKTAAFGNRLMKQDLEDALPPEEKENLERDMIHFASPKILARYNRVLSKKQETMSQFEWKNQSFDFHKEQFYALLTPEEQESARANFLCVDSAKAMKLLQQAYSGMNEERKAQVNAAADNWPGVGRERTERERRYYGLSGDIQKLRDRINADGNLDEAEKNRRLDALSGAEDLVAGGDDAVFSVQKNMDAAWEKVRGAREQAIMEIDREKYRAAGQPAYLDRRSNMIIYERRKTLGDIPDSPPLPERTKKAVIDILKIMNGIPVLDPGDSLDEEQGKKEYSFHKLGLALEAFRNSVTKGDSSGIAEQRQAVDREMENARKMIRIAKEGFGQERWNAPGNLGLERTNRFWPYEIINEEVAHAQVNALFSLYTLMKEANVSDAEEFVNHLTKYALQVHQKRAEARSLDTLLREERVRKGKDAGFADVMDLMVDVPSAYAKKFDSYNAMPRERWTWGLSRLTPDNENKEEVHRYTRNMLYLIEDTQYRAKVRVAFLTNGEINGKGDERDRQYAVSTVQNLLAVAAGDLKLDEMVGYPGTNEDGTMKDPFDLDAYLKNHLPDAAELRSRLDIMLKRMEEAGTEAALTQNEIVEAAMTVCDRAQYAYLKDGGSPEDTRYSELGKLGSELYEKLPEDMRKSADERRLAAGDIRGALRSDSAAEELRRSLEDANKSVWFGSKEFDAVLEAVRGIEEKRKTLSAESAIIGAEGQNALRDLRESYLQVSRTASAYLNKKLKEGKLSEAGQKRMLAVGIAIKKLRQERDALDRKIKKLPKEKKSPEELSEEAIRNAKSSLPEIGQMLDRATKGVWFGSEEFDAVAKAVKDLEEKQKSLLGGASDENKELPLYSDLAELQQDYDKAIQAAQTYIKKKEGEGSLNKNGEMRLNTVREVIARLKKNNVSLGTAREESGKRVRELVRAGREFLKQQPVSPEVEAADKALRRVSDLFTRPEQLTAENRQYMERDLAIAMAVFGCVSDSGLSAVEAVEQADRVVQSDMLGGKDYRTVEQMLLANAADGGKTLRALTEKAGPMPEDLLEAARES